MQLWKTDGMADAPDSFDNFITPLEQMAIVVNETFIAYVRAGFTENQALRLTMKSMELSSMLVAEIYDDMDLDEDE